MDVETEEQLKSTGLARESGLHKGHVNLHNLVVCVVGVDIINGEAVDDDKGLAENVIG